jgi:hypothetical protein
LVRTQLAAATTRRFIAIPAKPMNARDTNTNERFRARELTNEFVRAWAGL